MTELPEKIVLLESPIAEVRARLEKKLNEYHQRREMLNAQYKVLGRSTPPEILASVTNALLNVNYKFSILEKLLSEGEVNLVELMGEMQKDSNFDRDFYNSAFFTINDYCVTGGKNVRGGSGF